MNLVRHWNATKIGAAGMVLSAVAAGGFYNRLNNLATPENIQANIQQHHDYYETYCASNPKGSLGFTIGPDIPFTPLGKPIHPYTTKEDCKKNLAIESVTIQPFIGFTLSAEAALIFGMFPFGVAMKKRLDKKIQEMQAIVNSEPSPPTAQ